MQVQNKTWTERVVHAVGFEALALLLCAPLGAWILGKPVLEIGLLSALISAVAMAWNMIYNAGFDFFWPVARFARTLKVRALHAIGFEGGLILICVPMTAFVLDSSLAYAFAVEVGFLLAFLPYTIAYNWVYDSLRARWVASLAGASGRG